MYYTRQTEFIFLSASWLNCWRFVYFIGRFKVLARVGTQNVLPHESLWDCHIYKDLYDSQHCQNQIANTTSSIHKLPLDYLFMSGETWVEFSCNPSYKNRHYVLKTTAFSFKKTKGKKKIEDWIVTLWGIYCQPTKVICWIAWRYQEPCGGYYSVSCYYEPLALILNFPWLLVCVKDRFQMKNLEQSGYPGWRIFLSHLFPVTSPLASKHSLSGS